MNRHLPERISVTVPWSRLYGAEYATRGTMPDAAATFNMVRHIDPAGAVGYVGAGVGVGVSVHDDDEPEVVAARVSDAKASVADYLTRERA